MEELFGLSMTTLMYVLLAVVLASMAALGMLAARNRVMLKMGLRPIPRRPGQTALIIVGVMLSTVIMAAAFGTGDTLSFSIRNEAVAGLRQIDVLVVPSRAGDDASFGAVYLSEERSQEIRADLASNDKIDGIMPQISDAVPVQNRRTKLTEGRMNLVGLDPAMLEGFGSLSLVGGGEAQLQGLSAGEVFISEEGVEELDARNGDEIDLFLEDRTETLVIAGVLERGGFAGVDPTLVMPLSRAQALRSKPGQINAIVISNRGGDHSGAELSEDVAKELRVMFNDPEVAAELKALFNQAPVVAALEKKLGEEDLDEDLKGKLEELVTELQRPELTADLNGLLADGDLMEVVLEQIQDEGVEGVPGEAFTLLRDLSELRVIEIKRDLIDVADQAGSAVTSIFVLFSSFSIIVGILLIFLIFVMLAAARQPEMGMARAVGARRSHLVMMFAFEGTAYAILSASIGVVLGLGVSTLMVTVMNRIFSDFGEEFTLAIHFEPRSVVVAYCLGMAITFGTVAVSAYRVSRLNIVVAIRGLPEAIMSKGESPFTERLIGLLKAVVLPAYYLAAAVQSLRRPVAAIPGDAEGRGVGGSRLREFAKNIGLAVVVAVVFPVWLVSIAMGLIRFGQPYLVRGWLVFVGGAALTYLSVVRLERESWFGAGVSLSILGLGLMLRRGLGRTAMRAAVVDRLAFTATGVLMLAFWALPSSLVESIVGDLEGDADVMISSGIAMVGAAVCMVMYNADLFTRLLPSLTSLVGRLRPVLFTAVAYPMGSKLRTGLTLAMFALVIFTLVIMSVLTRVFSTQFEEPRKIFMGFDVGGTINFNSPVDDIGAVIDADADLRASDFEVVAGYTQLPLEVRQREGERGRWLQRTWMFLNDDFLAAAEPDMKLIAEGYGATTEEVLEAMRADPTLAIAGGWLLPNEGDLARGGDEPRLFGDLHYESPTMKPVSLEVREPQTGAEAAVTIIGVFDRVHSPPYGFRMMGSKELIDETAPFPVPLTHYRFRLSDGADAKGAANALEVALLENGMQTEVFEETIEEENAASRAFFRLFTGFMALGLFVGVAALGVVSTRAVVERRQQIGVLRAIGYTRGMIALSFLLESSFVSILGSIIGLVLGLLLSYNVVSDIRAESGIAGLSFSVPWLQLGVILSLTYGFSLLTTFLPARQASRIYPSEALRFE